MARVDWHIPGCACEMTHVCNSREEGMLRVPAPTKFPLKKCFVFFGRFTKENRYSHHICKFRFVE